jgi:hypothetical protein
MRYLLCLILFVCSQIAMAGNAPQTISWNAPTNYINNAGILTGTVITYDVYFSATGNAPTAAAPWTHVAGPLNVLTYTVAAPANGKNCYYVTATIAGLQSQNSDWVCKLSASTAVPKAPPNVTVTTGT